MNEQLLTRAQPLVLVVDDELSARLIMRATLEESGFDVVEAADGTIGLAEFERGGADIVLLDLMMPQVNGWDVIKYVRASYDKSEMAIIVVSLLNNKDNIDDFDF